jgi:hypothetical protein
MVYSLLRAVQRAPSQEDFIAWLDEPSYEPVDRLLLKHGEQLVAHAQILNRSAWFHGIKVPVAGLLDLATLPEYAQAGYEQMLISAAEDLMRERGAVVSLVHTRQPETLVKFGWTEVRVPGYSCVSVGDLLAHLTAHGRQADAGAISRQVAAVGGTWKRRAPPPEIRLWRQVELSGVRAVYDAAAADGWGALERSDSYWHWLMGRASHSELIVAAVGQAREQIVSNGSDLAGYALVCGGHVLEIGGLPNYGRVRSRLLARACQDAIEQDQHTISLHTAASDPLHELIVTAGGSWCSDPGPAGALVAKLLDPARWVEAIYPLLRRRAKAAGLRLPLSIGFDADGDRSRLVISRRSSRLLADELDAPDVCCPRWALDQLLIGNGDVNSLISGGELRGSDTTCKTLTALLPPALFWQSHFDMLRY